MCGVQVGRVEGIVGGNNPVRLNLAIFPDQARYVPSNVEAQIRATTAFGAKYVDLVTPENPSSKAISPGTVLCIRRDWQSFGGFADAYANAAQDIMKILDNASTTSDTITQQATQLDALLTNVIGFSNSGIGLLAPNVDALTRAVNTAEPTVDLLMKYNPQYTCMLVGGKWFLDNGGYDFAGGANGKSVVVDAGPLFGDDPYKYPQHLPVIAAKGGPGGKPSCGSLPIVDNNWPVRQLVTNTGFGTGLDWRPNPGIGHPFYANYLPVRQREQGDGGSHIG